MSITSIKDDFQQVMQIFAELQSKLDTLKNSINKLQMQESLKPTVETNPKSPKTLLQELSIKKYKVYPTYSLVSKEDLTFTSSVLIETLTGSHHGVGSTRIMSEINAAKNFLEEHGDKLILLDILLQSISLGYK